MKLLVYWLRGEGDLGPDPGLSESSERWLEDSSLFLQWGRYQEGRIAEEESQAEVTSWQILML